MIDDTSRLLKASANKCRKNIVLCGVCIYIDIETI